MTKSARPQHEVEEVRENILKNALDIIIDEGYSQMSMRKIAARCKMSATNIYNYFSNKDEIYLSLVISGFENLRKRFDAISSENLKPLDKGRKLMRAYLEFGIENRHYYEIMFTRPTPKFNDYVGTSLEELATIELKHSMTIAKIATETVSLILDIADIDSNTIKNKVMQLWSLLHGMVSLYHSNIAEYVVDDQEALFNSLENELIISFSRTNS